MTKIEEQQETPEARQSRLRREEAYWRDLAIVSLEEGSYLDALDFTLDALRAQNRQDHQLSKHE